MSEKVARVKVTLIQNNIHMYHKKARVCVYYIPEWYLVHICTSKVYHGVSAVYRILLILSLFILYDNHLIMLTENTKDSYYKAKYVFRKNCSIKI